MASGSLPALKFEKVPATEPKEARLYVERYFGRPGCPILEAPFLHFITFRQLRGSALFKRGNTYFFILLDANKFTVSKYDLVAPPPDTVTSVFWGKRVRKCNPRKLVGANM